MGFQIFISYRRADQPALAEWLYDRLACELQVDEVFFDREALESGEVFSEKVQRAIESAPVFIALIGPQWNPLTTAGARRLDNALDYVRREVAAGLECIRTDSRRLFLPVLFDGAAIPPDEQLPACLHSLRTYNAVSLSLNYRDGLRQIEQTVVRRLDELDATAPEEKRILRKITDVLAELDRHRIRQIGRELKLRFPAISTAPESARALARSIYAIGPVALECLLTLGKPDGRIALLLELLATHWIKTATAQTLRQTLGQSQVGKKIALECNYPDFTPRKCLLKASPSASDWPVVPVKEADEPEEIVEQIHEELLLRFSERLSARKTKIQPDNLPDDTRRQRERAKICEILARRRVDERRALPVILMLDHRTALDRTVIQKVQQAFPPLHILVATVDPDELKITGSYAAILAPSDTEEEERDAYDAYTDAREIITERERGMI
jgi:hypothetical protein